MRACLPSPHWRPSRIFDEDYPTNMQILLFAYKSEIFFRVSVWKFFYRLLFISISQCLALTSAALSSIFRLLINEIQFSERNEKLLLLNFHKNSIKSSGAYQCSPFFFIGSAKFINWLFFHLSIRRLMINLSSRDFIMQIGVSRPSLMS